MGRVVYVDNAATTKVSKKVIDAMLPYLTEHYGNASSVYSIGRQAKNAVEESREKIAKALGANTSEIFFTSGGSESNNWAIKGLCDKLKAKGKNHIITSVFEHHAVLHIAESLEKMGWDVTYIDVDSNGLVSPADVEAAIREDTALVSIMYANNEIGTIQPIAEIGAICRRHGVIFHTDAVQAVGNVDIDVAKQNIDMLSLSGHKIHTVKGIGALYVRKGIALTNLIEGGAQERGKRAGTENVAGIVALGVAVEEAISTMAERTQRLSKMRDRLISELLKIDRSHLNGDREKRLAGNANISFEGVEGESMLLMLDMLGICASSGSACTSGSLDPSHVLLSIGRSHEVAHGSLRISLSDDNTDEDIDYILEKVPPIIKRLRDMSPLWERIIKNEDVINERCSYDIAKMNE